MALFPPLRSALFVPGDRPDRIDKAVRAGADAVIVDLEDAVSPAAKTAARDTVNAKIAQWAATTPLIVRINALAAGMGRDDLAAAVQAHLAGIMAPMVETPADVERLDGMLRAAERRMELPNGGVALLALLESARGVQRAFAIAEALRGVARPVTLAFGAADFCADMGVALTREGEILDYPRARLALACRAAGLDGPLDSPLMVDLKNTDLLRQDARRAQRLGCQGKLCVHPVQVPVCNAVFSPSREEIEHARRVVAAVDAAEASGGGVIELDGKMIDAPFVAQARRVLARVDNHG